MKTTRMALDPAVNAETFDDIIFDGRNLKYGAYLLRKTYNKNVAFSQLASLLLVLLLLGLVFFRKEENPPSPSKPPIDIGATIIITDDFKFDVEPLPEKALDEVIEDQKEQTGGDWKVVEETTADESVPANDDQTDDNNADNTGDHPSPGPTDNTGDPKLFGDDITYGISDVNEPPYFKKGGTLEDFRIWLARNISYPEDAITNDINGVVKARFTVGKDGKVTDVKIERGVHPIIDQAVVKALLSSPKWTPAKLNGREVKMFYYVPIRFNLQH